MKSTIAALTATIALTLPAYAAGDAENGEKEFRKCKSCHMIASADETIVKGGRTGPNLYGVAGRTAGSQEDFKYSDLMTAAGEKGLEWNEEDFIGYVQEPTDWLKEYTGEDGRAKMTYKVRKEEDAADLWAYLSSLGADS
ncbi:c-type cytochrome [Roseovarius indicus]|uniref:c-type cytochrome n=1 Tax=Roseovarius indicus TaxID=540747 RepID=UPI0007D9EA3C|nr:c-type cytochrome [Roseovarius indicus]OAO08523.1 cytochrome C [Roseovarius indicus]